MSSQPGRADPFSVRKVVQAAAGGRLYVNDTGMIMMRLGRYDSREANIRANKAAVRSAEDQGFIVLNTETQHYAATDAGREAMVR